MEKQIAELATLRKHIYNYSDIRAMYEAYRKAGYSRKFYEAHRQELTIHKAAKQAFDELGVKKIPTAKKLSIDIARLMEEKKAKFQQKREAEKEANKYLVIQENIASLYEAERKETEADHRRQQEQER